MCVARTDRCCGPQQLHGYRLRSDVREGAHGPGSWRGGPGNGAKWHHPALLCVRRGVHTGPALLSSRRHGETQRTTGEGYAHGANAMPWVPHGRHHWSPGPHLCPNWWRRDRPSPTFGPGAPASAPNTSPLHGYHWVGTVFPHVWYRICECTDNCMRDRQTTRRLGTFLPSVLLFQLLHPTPSTMKFHAFRCFSSSFGDSSSLSDHTHNNPMYHT